MTPIQQQRAPDTKAPTLAVDSTILEDSNVSTPAPHLTVDPSVFTSDTRVIAPVPQAAATDLFGHLTDGPTAPAAAVTTPAVTPAPVTAPVTTAPVTTAAAPAVAGATPGQAVVPKPKPTLADYSGGLDKGID